MITEQELFNIGFRRHGDHEDDPYYVYLSKVNVLSTRKLSGNFTDKGAFEIYGVPQVFTTKDNLSKWIAIVGFIPDLELSDRYGSKEPLNIKP